jgi:hypothetical protein
MLNSLNGVQLPSKIGRNFSSQYAVPDTGLTNNTTLSNNPLYNLLQVVFNGKKTDNISYNQNAIMLNGLNVNAAKGDHKLFTKA